jgi:hypothetical protein
MEQEKACPDTARWEAGDRESGASGRRLGVRVPARDTLADRLVVVLKSL